MSSSVLLVLLYCLSLAKAEAYDFFSLPCHFPPLEKQSAKDDPPPQKKPHKHSPPAKKQTRQKNTNEQMKPLACPDR